MYGYGAPYSPPYDSPYSGYRGSVSPLSPASYAQSATAGAFQRSISPIRSHSSVPSQLSPPAVPHSPPAFATRGGRPHQQHLQQAPPAAAAPPASATPQRDVILAAVHRHWEEPTGLPHVVRDVQEALALPSCDEAITLIEATLGKPLPSDMVDQCRHRIASDAPRPQCVNGMMCPYVGERTHLDRYTHPCPKFYDTGACPLADNATHAAFYSHSESGEGVGQGYAASSNASPRGHSSQHTPHDHSNGGGGYSGRGVYAGRPVGGSGYSTPKSPQTPRHSDHSPGAGQGALSPRSDGSFMREYEEERQQARGYPPQGSPAKFSEVMQPAEAWMSYFNLLRARDTQGLLNRHYTLSSNVQLTVKNEGLLTEYRGEKGIRKYVNWMVNRLTNPSNLSIVSINTAEEGPVRVTWKCPASGFLSVKEIIVFAPSGEVEKQRVTADYDGAQHHSGSSFRQRGVERPPPEPFSQDVRLRGTPLTPAKTPPSDRGSRNVCGRVICPRPTSPPSRQTPFHTYYQQTQDQSASPVHHHTPASNRSGARGRSRTPPSVRSRRQTKKSPHYAPERSPSPEDEAATKIQANFRGKLARKQAQEKKEEDGAATKIQANFRGRMARRQAQEKKEEEEAATKIQASFRGKLARKQVQEKKEEDEAATKIQANFRGRMARRQTRSNTPSRSPSPRESPASVPYTSRSTRTTRTTTTRTSRW